MENSINPDFYSFATAPSSHVITLSDLIITIALGVLLVSFMCFALQKELEDKAGKR